VRGRGPKPTGAPTAPIETDEIVDEALEQLLVEVVRETQPQPQRIYGEFRGMVAIVTGGATGIGRATALELARQGVHVAFNYLDDGDGRTCEEAERTAQELRQLEVSVFHRSCDVRDPRAVDAFVRDARQVLGGLQILVNNAGIARDRALWRMTDDQWRDVLETNLTGAFHMIRAAAPIFRAQQFGKIVNISSIHGLRSEFGLANYAASKAGLIGLTRSAAVELGPSNVNVNAVAPGYIRTTRLAEGVPAEVLDRARERTVLSRLGDPRDVAHVVVFLCSELARHITGAVIPVDGGHLL
jgi:NAD(P)-dependent dehydrogenase (short-subunit alcohol dehydrogenase family)